MCVRSTLDMAVEDFLRMRDQVGDPAALSFTLLRYDVDRAEIIDLVAWRGEEPVCVSM